jgi:hypothetical protein
MNYMLVPFRRSLRPMMPITLAVVLFFGFPGALFVYGYQTIIRSASPELSRAKITRTKLTNGYFVVWAAGESDKSTSPPIEVFDRNGSLVATINVIASFPEAQAVSVMALPIRTVASAAFAGWLGEREPLVRASRCVMTADGRFIVQVQSRAENVEPGLYILSKNSMLRYPIDREDALRNSLLLGLDNSELVFVRKDVSRNEFQIFWRHP